jgi:hypothetical protein
MFSIGLFAHIGYEVIEFPPPITNLDAAPTVVRVFGVVFIAATLNHHCPGVVFWGSCHTMRSQCFCHPLVT